mmetsp:Transcript_21402/g.42859  ORF Transcript_21402/g.42859 Transcript_21402/m.42859 type:complete len:202 (+) Transcript_21402:708-1313(+)
MLHGIHHRNTGTDFLHGTRRGKVALDQFHRSCHTLVGNLFAKFREHTRPIVVLGPFREFPSLNGDVFFALVRDEFVTQGLGVLVDVVREALRDRLPHDVWRQHQRMMPEKRRVDALHEQILLREDLHGLRWRRRHRLHGTLRGRHLFPRLGQRVALPDLSVPVLILPVRTGTGRRNIRLNYESHAAVQLTCTARPSRDRRN